MHITTKPQRTDALAKLAELQDSVKAAGRDMTDDEVKTADDTLTAIKEYDRRTEVEAKSAEMGLASTNGTGEHFDLSFKSAASFARQAIVSAGGVKAALDATAVADLPTTRETGVDLLPAAARTFLSLFETRKRTTRTWTYLVQAQREDAAALVNAGDVKPTSKYGIKSVTGELRPLAHLSEPVDKYDLRDAAELEAFLAGEMARGVFDAIEGFVLNGTGTGGQPRGLLATTGVHEVAAGIDDVSTLRSAIAEIETSGYVPGAVVMTPKAWAAIEAHRNTSGQFDADGPINSTDRKVWGTPVFTTTRLTDAQAIVVDRSAVIVSVDDHGVEVEWDSAGEKFTRNQYVCRAETRIDVEVRRPAGIAVAPLGTPGA